MDHCGELGATLADIARAKGRDHLRPAVNVAATAQTPRHDPVIADTAVRKMRGPPSARLIDAVLCRGLFFPQRAGLLLRGLLPICHIRWPGSTSCEQRRRGQYRRVCTGRSGVGLSTAEHIRRGPAATRWPPGFEVLRATRCHMWTGGHNHPRCPSHGGQLAAPLSPAESSSLSPAHGRQGCGEHLLGCCAMASASTPDAGQTRGPLKADLLAPADLALGHGTALRQAWPRRGPSDGFRRRDGMAWFLLFLWGGRPGVGCCI